jgi:monothiol glutaredoxin
VKIALYFNKGLIKEFHMTDMNQTDIEQTIRDQIAQHSVLLYMKGTPQFPQCGFSARAVDVLTQIGRPFAFVNILENPEIRATLPQIANWPTFPQLWVAGELIGGSDIIYQMFQDGELQPLIEANSPAV